MRMKTIAIALIAGIAAACSSAPMRDPGSIDERTTVTVDNRSFVPMTIYATRGQRIRLGTANPSTTTVFEIPPILLGGAGIIRFVADPIGSNRASVSEEISVNKGDDIGLMIPPT